MTGINLYDVQQDIKQYITDEINWPVYSGAVPEVATLKYVDGKLDPYVVLRFSDMMPTSGGGSFMGALHDEYYSYVDALCIGETDEEARELLSVVNRKLMGKKFDNASQITHIYGGGVFAVVADNRMPVAFVAIGSYRFGTNMEDVGSGSLIA